MKQLIFIEFSYNKMYNQKKEAMKWNKLKDEMLIREILTQKPWEYRSKSQERGQVWDNIAYVLNLLDGFMVNQRFIRDRYKTLATKYKQKKQPKRKLLEYHQNIRRLMMRLKRLKIYLTNQIWNAKLVR